MNKAVLRSSFALQQCLSLNEFVKFFTSTLWQSRLAAATIYLPSRKGWPVGLEFAANED